MFFFVCYIILFYLTLGEESILHEVQTLIINNCMAFLKPNIFAQLGHEMQGARRSLSKWNIIIETPNICTGQKL
jgi:hypothetical protein